MPEIADVHILDMPMHRAAFGIRCIDNATQQPVRDGLLLTLCPLNPPLTTPVNISGKLVSAFQTPSGIYAFEGVVGLREWEHDMSIAFPDTQFLLTCEDRQNRFLSCSVVLKKTNVQNILNLQLFSAPSRPPISGMTLLRGHIVQANGADRLPVGYVKIVADYTATPGILFTGLSDSRGEFLLPLPNPNPGSKASNPAAALPDRTWPLELRFSYDLTTQQYACISRENGMQIRVGPTQNELNQLRQHGGRCLPDLTSLLSQPALNVFVSTVATDVALPALVPFGRPATASTPGSPDSNIWLSS